MLEVCSWTDFKLCSVDIATIGFNNRTALHEASLGGHIEVIKFLLKRGVDVSAIGMSDWTNCLVGFVLNRMVDEDSDMALHYAVVKGHTNIVKLLVEHGADFNARGMFVGRFQTVPGRFRHHRVQ
jgi:ankyrin repeat protein